jgi:hypothetical protein
MLHGHVHNSGASCLPKFQTRSSASEDPLESHYQLARLLDLLRGQWLANRYIT